MKKIIPAFSACFLFVIGVFAQDPTALDHTFEMGIGGPIVFQLSPLDGRMNSRTVVLPGDTILLYGGFSSFSSVRSIARLGPDGAHDPTFLCTLFGIVLKIIPLSDGKLLVGGAFDGGFNSPGIQDLVRLHPNGEVDTAFQQLSFSSTLDEVYNPYITDFDIDSEGRILIAGNFTSINGADHPRIARLMPDGTFDASFDTGTGPSGSSAGLSGVLALPDGRILVGGFAVTWNGFDVGRTTVLLADGSVDTTFSNLDFSTNYFWSFVKQADGKIIRYRKQYTLPGSQLSRLNADLSEDSLFNPTPMQGLLNHVAVQPDGKMLISGVSANNSDGLVRLMPNGDLDSAFNVGAGFGWDYSRVVGTTRQSTGKILVTHDGSEYQGESLVAESGGSMWIKFLIRLEGENFPVGFIQNPERKDKLRLWPNPAADAFFVKTDSENMKVNTPVFIRDMQGREVMRTFIHQLPLRIETGHWAPGMYVVYVEGVGAGKVFVQ